MELNEQFRANPEYIYRSIAGEHLLVPVGKAAENLMGMASLNETGKFLWELLQQPQTVEALCSSMAAEYELTAEESLQDVSDFLAAALTKDAVIRI